MNTLVGRFTAALALALSLASCSGGKEVVGGQGVAGRYAAVVDLKPHILEQVEIEVYEDFTCPACQKFSLETLPALQKRYGDALLIRKHYVAAPSTQPSAVLLYHAAQAKKDVNPEAVATAIFRAGLEHESTPENDRRVYEVARAFGLQGALEASEDDADRVARVREEWASVSHVVAHFPFVVIEGEIATNGDLDNLFLILDSLLRSGRKNS